MKKNTLSKCSLAISIALGLFTSSAFAVNNDINPLTGAPINPVVSSTPATGNAIQLNSPSQSSPSGLIDESAQDQTSKSEEKSSTVKEEDYSYANEEQNLKKASNLKVQLTILDLENQIKTKKDELKGIKPDSNQQNNQNGLNVNSMNQQNPQQQVQQAPKPVYETVETKTPAVKATAVYGLGKDVFAEIYVGDNKYVMNVGSTLPNGYKLVGVNNFGVTLKKGGAKIQLPIVAVPREGANISVTTQKRLVSQENRPENNVVNSPQPGLGVNIPPEMK